MHPLVRPGLFLLCLLPLLVLSWAGVDNRLGPDPAELLMHETGEWAARLLILTLLISPLREWGGWPKLVQLRRMLGLFCFFYASVHLLLFVHFYLGWTAARVLEEIIERPYVTAGFTGWLILVPLALTSTRGMQRRLRRSWQTLHRGVYLVAIAVSLHFLWQARSDIGEALVYSTLFALLIGWRVLRYWKKQRKLASNGLANAS